MSPDLRTLRALGHARRNAVLEAEGTRFIERQADAWKQVQSAGESAIDSVLDKLKAGDVDGAMSDFIGEIEKGFFDLAVRNPLKNALFGGNLGTLDDLGGISGIFDRLTGKTGIDEAALVSQATTAVQSMAVNATNVTIGGVGLQPFLGQAGAANLTNAPFGMGTTGASASFLQSVAVGGGARPDAISGLNQSFADPLAAMIRDAQKVFGDGAVKITSAFRSVERQQDL